MNAKAHIPSLKASGPRSVTDQIRAALDALEDRDCLYRVSDLSAPVAKGGLALKISPDSVRLRLMPALVQSGHAFKTESSDLGVRPGTWLLGHPEKVIEALKEKW